MDELSQVDLKKLQGSLLSQAWEDFVKRVETDPDSLSLDDWYVLTPKLMARPEVIQAFLQVLNWFRANPEYTIPMRGRAGRGRFIRIKNTPSQSRVFKDLFLTYAGIDIRYGLSQDLRDPITTLSFVVAGMKRETTTTKKKRTFSELGDADE